MNKVTFNCEIITPMFMSGADGKTPELRPSEFKGMMRFWWRAIKAENDIGKLRKEEASLFGGTGEGEGKSKIRIMITNSIPKDAEIGQNIKNEIENYPGLKYLFYSTFTLRSQGEQIIRKYIKATYKFDIMLSSLESEIDCHKQALASLWLSIYLGGFGTRARRGGGSIAISGFNDKTSDINFIPIGEGKKELSEWIEKNLNIIKLICKTSSNPTLKYTILPRGKILIFDGKKDWKEALEFFGLKFSDYRKNNKSCIWNMSAFGMPIMHNGFKVRMVPYKDGNRISERRASPLIVKVIKLNKLFFPIIIVLSGEIAPQGTVGKEEKNNKQWSKAGENNIKQVNYSKVYEFLDLLNKDKPEIIKI